MNKLLIIGVILIIIGGIIGFFYFKNESLQCVQNPISYYELNQNTSCWCVNNPIKNIQDIPLI